MIAAAPPPELYEWCLAVIAIVGAIAFPLVIGRLVWVSFQQPWNNNDEDNVEGCDADHVS